MSIRESALSLISSISQSDYLRAVTSGGNSRRVTMANAAKAVVEGYSGSSLGGSQRTVKAAIDAMANDVDIINKIAIKNTASGPVASFPDGSDGLPIQSLIADINPVQSGSGTPSPTNVRPISGRSSVEVMRTGKNFLSPSTWASGYSTQNSVTCTRNADNSYSFSGTASANTWFYINTYDANHAKGFLIPSGTYVVSCEGLTNGSPNGYRFQASLYKNGVMSSNAKAYDSTNETLTITDGDLTEAYIYVPSGKNMSGITLKPMIRLASVTDSTFEPFGNTYTTALGRTVYGGTLDVVSGGLSDEWTSQTINGANLVSDIAERTNSIRFWYYMGTSVPQTSDVTQYAIIADGLQTATTDPQVNDVIGVRTATAYPYSICCSYPKGLFSADATSINNYLQSNPLQIVYKKRTPQTYQLTPQQIQTLLGTNNVWANSGDVEVVYIADTKLYVDNH